MTEIEIKQTANFLFLLNLLSTLENQIYQISLVHAV